MAAARAAEAPVSKPAATMTGPLASSIDSSARTLSGPAGVGNAVNETVVYTFMALFFINIVATAVGVQVTL